MQTHGLNPIIKIISEVKNMDEKDMSQIFSEAMRLYAERIKQSQSLGPFKKILNGESAIVQVSLDNATLVVNEAIIPRVEPKKSDTPIEVKAESTSVKSIKRNIQQGGTN